MGTPLKAWHYASKGIDSYNIYKGPEGFFPIVSRWETKTQKG